MPRTRCPHCGWKDEVDEEFIGKHVECPECEEEFLSKRLKKKKKRSFSSAASSSMQVDEATMANEGCGVYQEGNALVVKREAVFPSRCVKCNKEATDHIRHRFSHVSPLILLTFPCGILPVLVLYFIFRKTVVSQIPLCGRHKNLRKITKTIGILLTLLSFIGFLYATSGESVIYIAVCGVSFIFGLAFIIASRPLSLMKIDDYFVTFEQVNIKFLQSLPSRR